MNHSYTPKTNSSRRPFVITSSGAHHQRHRQIIVIELTTPYVQDHSSVLFVHSAYRQTSLNIGSKVKEEMASNQSSSPLVVGLIVVVMIVSMVSVVSLTYAFTHTSAATGVTVTQTEVAVTETSTQTQTEILQVPGNSYSTRPSTNRYATRQGSGQPPTSTVQASEYGLVESNGWMQTENGCQIQLINMPAGYAGQSVTVYGTITYTNTNVCPTSIIVSSVT
jgi:hypothetical protein